MRTKFGVDSSSRFPFSSADRQTEATECPTHDGGCTAGVGKYIDQGKRNIKLGGIRPTFT